MLISESDGVLRSVSGTTRLYGIIGYPVAHSLSPLMHTCAFQHHGLDCLYVPFPVAPECLARAVAGAAALGICGFNVTIPHKEAIMAQLDEVSAEARFIGAVNTVQISEGRTIGQNTDGEGFLQPLRALQVSLAEAPVLVLGAGGAARAITMAVLRAGCPELVVANRTSTRGERLAAVLQERFLQAQVYAVPFERAAQAARRSKLIVNATAAGLHNEEGALLPDTCFRADQIVYDIVYRPPDTSLLRSARCRGATVIPGIEMLIGQGAAAFQIWTALTFPVETVRRVLQPFLQPLS